MMKIEVTVDGQEIATVIGEYLKQKFKNLAGQHEYLYVLRLGDFPKEITFSLEAKRNAPER